LNPIRFSTKYVDRETDLVYYGYRYYSSTTGRWLGRDPGEEAASRNVYGFLRNDGVNHNDYLGLVEIPKWKQIEQLITDSITGSAETLYNFIQAHELSQWQISTLNSLLGRVKIRANAIVDTNPKTMNWSDLALAWFFELGAPPFEFADEDRTTQDLKTHYGVNAARQKAKAACKRGDHRIDYSSVYGRPEFWRSIAEVDTAAEFLGSYNVTVESSTDC